MAYTVLSTGGAGTRGGGQAKTVAVPLGGLFPTSDLSVLTVSVDRERIYNAPVFDFARIDEYASTGYANNIYSYYGVSGQVGVSGQPSVTGGATATTAGTASSPIERAQQKFTPWCRRRNHGAKRYTGTGIDRQRSKTKGRKPRLSLFILLLFEHSDPSQQHQDEDD